jgi:hypothetical protein
MPFLAACRTRDSRCQAHYAVCDLHKRPRLRITQRHSQALRVTKGEQRLLLSSLSEFPLPIGKVDP